MSEANPRIRVTGGPWPERIGALGRIVADPGDGIYPFDKRRPKSEIIVKLDDDPLGHSTRYWTCVMNTKHIEYVSGRGVSE